MNRLLTAGVITIASMMGLGLLLVIQFLECPTEKFCNENIKLITDILLLVALAGIALPIPIVIGLYIRERVQRKRTS